MLLFVLILCFVAGYLTVAALRSSDTPWRGSDLVWGCLIGLAGTSWLGQALADLGWFHVLAIVGALCVYSSVLALRLGRRIVPRGMRVDLREIALLAVILVVGAALFFWPAETPIGGRDDGIRVMAGATVARQGGWLQHAPLLMDLPLYRGTEGDFKHMGFLIWDAERELVVPQFTGAHEVWQAIAWGLRDPDLVATGGVRAAHPLMFYLNPLLALGALGACYVLGRSVFGRNAAFVGTLLLALNVAQIWYARQTMGEILLQTLLLDGIAASVAYMRAPSRVTALATGLAFGVALLTKVDALIAIGALGGVLLLVWPQRRFWPYWIWLFVPLALAIAHYIAHSLWFSADYWSDNFANQLHDPTLAILVVLGAGVAGSLFALRMRFRNTIDPLMTHPLAMRWRVAGLSAVLFLIGYAYFVRPTVLAGESYVHSVWSQRFQTYRGLNLVMLVAYLTPVGFVLALWGLSRSIICELRWHHFPFFGVALGYAVVFTYNAMIVGDQPFWVRRFLPVVIPGTLLLASSAIAALWAARKPWRWSAPLFLVLAVGSTLWQTAPIALIRSGSGLSAQVADFAATIPSGAVVLFQDWQAAFDLAAPLEVLYGRESYVLTGEQLRGEVAQQWHDQLMEWQRAERPLVYVATDGALTVPADGLRWQTLDRFTLQYRTIETTHDRLPAGPTDVAKSLTLYQIVPATTPTTACSTTIEVGGDDYGAIGSGFYPSEQLGERTVRWTKGEASIVVPATGQDAVLTLTLGDARPPQAGAATLRISNNGTELAAFPLQGGWHEYEINLPASVLAQPAPILLDLSVAAWSPAQVGQPDARKLGVIVDKFVVQQSCVE